MSNFIGMFLVGVVLTIVSTTLYLVSLITYRLFFHPLSKYPGPKLAAISEIWYAHAWTSGRYPLIIESTHRTYGADVIRIAPNQLSFASVQSWRDIYGHNIKGKKTFIKGPFYDNQGAFPNVAGVRDPAEHARQRKYLSHAFSAKALRDQEVVVQGYVDLFLGQLRKLGKPEDDGDGKGGGGLNVSEAFNWLTFDVIGDLSFGESFDAVKQGRTHDWIKIILTATYWKSLADLRRRLPAIKFVMPWLMDSKLAGEYLTKHHALSKEKILRRMDVGDANRDDFFSHIFRKGGGGGKGKDDDDDTNDTSSSLPFEELRNQSNVLIVAGSETTATTLTAITYFLAKDPARMANLQHEVRSRFGSNDEITGDATLGLEYLHGVIEEALRLYSPVAFGMERVVCPGGANVDGNWVPEGTIVGMNNFVLHRDPRYWRQPLEFLPERWIGDGFEGDVKEASQPFSLGPRACLGMNLAYLELRITVAKMVYNFDWELVNKEVDLVKESAFYILWSKPDVVVRYYPRTVQS